MKPSLPPLLTIRQISEALTVSVPMVYKLVREGVLPVVQLGSSVRIHPDDLTAFINERRGRRKATEAARRTSE